MRLAPLDALLLSQFAVGGLGDEREGMRCKERGKQKEKNAQQEAVIPCTSPALRLEPQSFSTDRSKRRCSKGRGYMHGRGSTGDSKTLHLSFNFSTVSLVYITLDTFFCGLLNVLCFMSCHISATGI